MSGMWILVLFVLVAIAAPLLADKSDLSVSAAARESAPILLPPSWILSDRQLVEYGKNYGAAMAETAEEAQGTWKYPLGTDAAGRSILSEIIWGSRISLIVGLTASFFTMVIGSGVGLAGGYFRGKIDLVLERFTDWFLVMPWVILAIVLATIMGPSLWSILVVLAIVSWPTTSRLIRAQALSVRERPFVERARSLGGSHWHIITRHMLPNTFPIILANTILMIAAMILSESYLSFLGLGDPNSISWGKMLDDAMEAGATTGGQWWYIITPGLAITITVLAFSMVGVAVEEITNPRLRKR